MYKGPEAQGSWAGGTEGIMERIQIGGSSGNIRNDGRRG